MKPFYNDSFMRIITSTHGAAGREWLEQLPELIEACVQQWDLTDLTPFTNLTYSYVLAGLRDDKPVVLKLRCDTAGLHKELNALQALRGYGCVTLLDTDLSLGALLIERMVPGTMLTTLFAHDDARAVAITSSVIRQLHTAPLVHPERFETLEQLLPDFSQSRELLKPFLERGQALKDQLLATATNRVVLHGDIHYDNILAHGDQWCVIDPYGVVGDPVYDVTVCIRHPLTRLLQEPNPQKIIADRIDLFAYHLASDRQRIYDWTYVQAVTSAYWSIDDGLDASRHLQFLALLQDIKLS